MNELIQYLPFPLWSILFHMMHSSSSTQVSVKWIILYIIKASYKHRHMHTTILRGAYPVVFSFTPGSELNSLRYAPGTKDGN